MGRTKSISARKRSFGILDAFFILFSLSPFIIPNPIIVTNIQPYACVFGVTIIARELLAHRFSVKRSGSALFGVAAFTFVMSVLVMLFSDFSTSAFRAIYNYFAVMIIPYAAYLSITSLGEFPERAVKALILLWFGVATVQFFVSRSFMTGIISGVRFSSSYRGVVGLASEPSFLGISCFYFLHMISKFKKGGAFFYAITLLMGVVYAQSAMGIIFIGAYILMQLVEVTNTRRGAYIWLGAFVAGIAFLIILNTAMVGTRMHEIYTKFMKGGLDSILKDESAGNRFDALEGAILDPLKNFLMPMGYTTRIGSGYGGFLCELGLFSLPILICISRAMSVTFKRTVTRAIYFAVVTFLLFNNTQVGNPLLLFVIGANVAVPSRKTPKRDAEGG